MGQTIVEYKGGMSFQGRGASGHPVEMDADRAVGGGDAAARPVEVLLCSLGGCTGMDVVSILRKMKTEPAGLHVEIEDERAAEHPKAITRLHLTYVIEGDVPEANAAKAVGLSLEKYCPIVNMLKRVAQFTSEIRLIPSH
jgi:putative redox protein